MKIQITGRYADTPIYVTQSTPIADYLTAQNKLDLRVITSSRADKNGDDSYNPAINPLLNSLKNFDPSKLYRFDFKTSGGELEIGTPPAGGVSPPTAIVTDHEYVVGISRPQESEEIVQTRSTTAETGRFTLGNPVVTAGDGTVTAVARLQATDGSYPGAYSSLEDFNAAVNNLSDEVAREAITYQLQVTLTSGSSATVKISQTPQLAV